MTSFSLTIPPTQRAIVAGLDGDFQIFNDVPVAELEPHMILIKTVAVALNPVDTKLVGDFVRPGVTFGFDCAGIVVAVGSAVDRDIKPGDRVCGSADGMNHNRPSGGAFAEYVTLHSQLALVIPDSLPFEAAAALRTAVASGAMALFWSLQIPASLTTPPEESTHVLVYGGSSSTGTMMIQLIKACGLIPITTCSPKNFDLVKSYGAAAAFDYKSPDCAEAIRNYTSNELEYAVDCITQESSMKLCYAALGRAVVRPDWILATRIAGLCCTWPAPYASEADPKFLEWSAPLYKDIQKLPDEGKIRPHPIVVSSGGFEAGLEGVGKLRRKEMGGQKLVYAI